jgi:serine phosphatase RsbU (regulator of sigma subunit)
MATAIPSEFELELRFERNRWLRRRLLWLCATGICLTFLLDIPDIVSHLSQSQTHYRRAGIVQTIECIALIAMYVATFIYARLVRLPERSLLQLVFRLLVSVAVVELLCRRVIDNILLSPQVAPELRVSSAWLSAILGLILLGLNHFLACLFMPWTVREALRPAGVFLAIFSASVIWDIARGHLDSAVLLTPPALAATFVPGLLICWWRSSRFRHGFRLRFESNRYRQLQGELASARRLHDAALPNQREHGPLRLHYVYEPMRQIGGDLLFVSPASETAAVISVVLLDVTGHGISAALTVNRLIGELERLFAESPDAAPDAILQSLNRYICLTLSRHNIYATALCLQLNGTSGKLQWANGGHPPAFIRRADGTLESIDSNAPMLGVLEAGEFFIQQTSAPLALNPGDVLLAYTDGLSEAANPDGKQLGVAGVKSLITSTCEDKDTPPEWPSALLAATLAYRQSPVEDDTLVLSLFRSPE